MRAAKNSRIASLLFFAIIFEYFTVKFLQENFIAHIISTNTTCAINLIDDYTECDAQHSGGKCFHEIFRLKNVQTDRFNRILHKIYITN